MLCLQLFPVQADHALGFEQSCSTLASATSENESWSVCNHSHLHKLISCKGTDAPCSKQWDISPRIYINSPPICYMHNPHHLFHSACSNQPCKICCLVVVRQATSQSSSGQESTGFKFMKTNGLATQHCNSHVPVPTKVLLASHKLQSGKGMLSKSLAGERRGPKHFPPSVTSPTENNHKGDGASSGTICS